MTCQATIPRIHLCAHTGVPCIIKGMNPTRQKLVRECQAGRTVLPSCPGLILELVPLVFFQVPSHHAYPPWTSSWDQSSQGSGPAHLLTANPRSSTPALCCLSGPWLRPPALPQHSKVLAEVFGSSGFDLDLLRPQSVFILLFFVLLATLAN